MSETSRMSNYNRLKEKGLLPSNLTLTESEMDAIANLSKDEVDTLLSIAKKLHFGRPIVFPDTGGLVKFF